MKYACETQLSVCKVWEKMVVYLIHVAGAEGIWVNGE